MQQTAARQVRFSADMQQPAMCSKATTLHVGQCLPFSSWVSSRAGTVVNAGCRPVQAVQASQQAVRHSRRAASLRQGQQPVRTPSTLQSATAGAARGTAALHQTWGACCMAVGGGLMVGSGKNSSSSEALQREVVAPTTPGVQAVACSKGPGSGAVYCCERCSSQIAPDRGTVPARGAHLLQLYTHNV